ncbi:extracellular calcium-sensing receptor-like [Lissotriton helveticus]
MCIQQLFLGLLMPTLSASGCLFHRPPVAGFSRDGEILIGAIVAVHGDRLVTPTSFTDLPSPVTCQKFHFQNYQRIQGMVFAIKEISNNPRLLANVTLGYRIYDSCTVLQRTLDGTLWMLTEREDTVPNYQCHWGPQLAAIIGDSASTRSIIMAHLLGRYRLPQVSYFSTSPLLSDRTQFPSFFRTIPSDDSQARGLAKLLVHFGWTWVGLLAVDSDYGRQMIHILQQELIQGGVCVAFSESILTSLADRNAFHVIQVIKTSLAVAVVIISSDYDIAPVVDEMVRQNITGKVWIGSESWSTSTFFPMEKYADALLGSLGFAIHSGGMLGFQDYLTSVQPSQSPGYTLIRIFWEEAFGCKWLYEESMLSSWDNNTVPCTGSEKFDNFKVNYNEVSDLRITYNIYSAVYAIALALQDLSNCHPTDSPFLHGACANILDFQPWQLPTFVCTPSCPPGFRKTAKPGEPICCFRCTPCPLGEISNHTDSASCFHCQWDKWPNSRQDQCIPKIKEFLSFQDSLGVVLASISIFLSTVPIAILGLFHYHRKTPIVKANNRSISYLLLLCLSLCFLCALSFIGYPTHVKCLLRQAIFGIIFSFCISCVLAKTIMVVIAFKATRPNSDINRWGRQQLVYKVISVCLLLQVCLCISWLCVSPPFSEFNTHTEPGKIIIECNEGSSIAFWCMLGYLGLLASISFIVAFLARQLPDSFNEAKFITFSMLAFLSVWLSFIPTYLSTKGKYMVAMEIFAILSSSSALLFCIFVPKCYILLLRPEMNSKQYLMGRRSGDKNKAKSS